MKSANCGVNADECPRSFPQAFLIKLLFSQATAVTVLRNEVHRFHSASQMGQQQMETVAQPPPPHHDLLPGHSWEPSRGSTFWILPGVWASRSEKITKNATCVTLLRRGLARGEM